MEKDFSSAHFALSAGVSVFNIKERFGSSLQQRTNQNAAYHLSGSVAPQRGQLTSVPQTEFFSQRAVFVAIIVASSPGAARQCFLPPTNKIQLSNLECRLSLCLLGTEAGLFRHPLLICKRLCKSRSPPVWAFLWQNLPRMSWQIVCF